MSHEALKDFMKEMSADAEQELVAFAQARDAGEQSVPQVLAAFAQEKGYDVTEQDITDLAHEKSDAHELSEDELELVAGGITLDEVAQSVGDLARKVGASVLGGTAGEGSDVPMNPLLALDAAFLSLKKWI